MTTRKDGDSWGREEGLRRLLLPLAVTLLSIAVVVGGFLLARLETARPSPTPTQAVGERPTETPFLPTLTPRPTLTRETPPPTEASPTRRPSPERETREPSLTPTATWTPPPTDRQAIPTSPSTIPVLPPPPPPRVCSPPPGWISYVVQPGDTLSRLARLSGTSTWNLIDANCLGTTALFSGQRLFLPRAPYPSPTPQPTPCGPPLDWVTYRVQAGDTLYSLSRRYQVTLDVLRRANCLESNAIYLGQPLWVPPITPLPSPSATPTRTPTATQTPPGGGPTPTATPEETSTLSPSATASATPTSTTAASPTPTATWTATHTPVPSPTPEPSPTQTSTPTPTLTPTDAPTATATATATATG